MSNKQNDIFYEAQEELNEPEFITCSECGLSFVANHECDPEVLRNRAEEEQRDRQEKEEERSRWF